MVSWAPEPVPEREAALDSDWRSASRSFAIILWTAEVGSGDVVAEAALAGGLEDCCEGGDEVLLEFHLAWQSTGLDAILGSLDCGVLDRQEDTGECSDLVQTSGRRLATIIGCLLARGPRAALDNEGPAR